MTRKKSLNFLISAGPTREPIDPIRFISNHSTGYLGYEMAKAAKKQGHKVILVSGPVALMKPAGVKRIEVTTAKEMLKSLKDNIRWANCLIMAAAVSDFRVKKINQQKIKKNTFEPSLQLIKNPDILKCLSAHKKGKIFVGFALETENLHKNALTKLKSKGLDLIIANQKDDKSTCFGETINTYHVINKSFNCSILKDKPKSYISRHIIDKSFNLWYNLHSKEKVYKIE